MNLKSVLKKAKPLLQEAYKLIKKKHLALISLLSFVACLIDGLLLLFGGAQNEFWSIIGVILLIVSVLFLLLSFALVSYRFCYDVIKRYHAYLVGLFPVEGDARSTKGILGFTLRSLFYEKMYKKRKHKPNAPQKVILCPHLTFCVSSMESIYLAMEERKEFDVSFLLLPTRQPGMDGPVWYYSEGLIDYFKSKKYKYKLAYENGKWVNLFKLNPDSIFFQTPYTSQRPNFYNPNIHPIFPKFHYTPYGPWVMDRSVTSYIESGIQEDFFSKLTHFFADRLSYEMLAYAAPKYLSKTILSGTPKVDYLRTPICPDTYCWKTNPKAKNVKKVIWLPRWGFAQGRTSFMDYYTFFLDSIRSNKELSFVLRPHPFMFKDLLKCKLFTESGIKELEASFVVPSNSNIDNGKDYREGLLSCDFLVADFTSILYEYLPTGKPIIYTPKDNTLVDPRIIEACYIVHNLEEMKETFNMLLRGEDPMKEKRLEIVEDLTYFPHEEKTNGHYIAQYLSENL